MLDTTIPIPTAGRTYVSTRRVRLSDMDAHGRVRLDAVARYLQDIAIDDVQETGWGVPEHLWFVRRMRVDVLAPFLADREIVLTTWSSGMAALAAARRWSLSGDVGGHAEVDSVWVHLDATGRPARIEDFGPYAETASARRASTAFELPDPGTNVRRQAWPLRTADVDLHGHVNNTVYWQAVEHVVADTLDLRAPHRAELEYRQPIDLGEDLELAVDDVIGFLVGDTVRAVARLAST